MSDIKPPPAAESKAVTDGNRLIVTEKGLAVTRSIPTIAVARAVMKSMEEVEEPTARRHARLRGLADGNPPYNQQKLDELSLGYTTNVNTRECGSILAQKANQHFESFNEVPTFAEFQVLDAQDDAQVQPRAKFEDVIGEEFTTTLQNWTGFLPLMNFLRSEADVVDLGVCAWRDQWDWRPVPISRGAFFPSPYARVEVETWDLAALADTLSPHDLLALSNDPEAAKVEGWNVAQIRRVLTDVFISGVTQDTQNGVDTGYADVSRWEQLQMKIRNNDPAFMAQMFMPVKVRHIFVREPKSGKISHLIMPTAICAEGDDFLCERHDEYADMSQALFVLPANFGNGFIRSVRGLASQIEVHCDVSNRFFGSILDAAKLSGTIMLKSVDGGADARRLQLVRAGLVTLLPKGCEALQASSYAPPLNTMVQVRALSEAVMRNNIPSVYRVVSENFVENQPQKTAREVAEISTKEARVEKAGVAFDFEMLQKLYREIFRRLISEDLQSDKTLPGSVEAKDFVRRCVRRGVPKDWLKPGKLILRITRSIGWGSLGVRLDVSNQLVGMRGLFDEAGRVNSIRDRVAALTGFRNVDRYLGTGTRDSIPSNEKSIARLENNDAMEGSQIDVGDDQNHAVHILVHIEPVQKLVQAVAEDITQVDPQRALPALDSFLAHIQGHLQRAATDPARAAFVKQVEEILKAGISARDQLAKALEQLQKQQQQIQEDQQARLAEADDIIQNRDAQLEEAKAERKLAMEERKQDSIVGMRVTKANESAAINRQRTAEDLRLKAERQAVELDLKRQLAAATAEIQRLKAGQG